MIEAVKSAIPLKGYLAEHGAEFVRDKARCLFHEDRTPSGSLYRGKDGFERFKCFGCGVDLDVVGAAQELHGLDFKGALKLLADRAGLTRRPADRQAIEAARQERKRKADLVEAFRTWEQAAADRLAALLRAFRGMQARARSEGDLETSAVLQGEIDTLEYRYEIFCRRDDREKFQIYEEAVGYAGAEI